MLALYLVFNFQAFDNLKSDLKLKKCEQEAGNICWAWGTGKGRIVLQIYSARKEKLVTCQLHTGKTESLTFFSKYLSFPSPPFILPPSRVRRKILRISPFHKQSSRSWRKKKFRKTEEELEIVVRVDNFSPWKGKSQGELSYRYIRPNVGFYCPSVGVKICFFHYSGRARTN